MSYATLQENFEKALETIQTLSDQNEELMDKIQELENKVSSLATDKIKIDPINKVEIKNDDRLNEISKGAEKAMKRYKQFLKKEFPNAKSKQTERQSV